MYVTDTHALVYFADQKLTRLGKNARRIFQKAEDNESLIYVPAVVLWEVSQLLAKRSLKMMMTFEQWCHGLDTSVGFSIAPLEWQDVNEARRFRFKDPFDCLIAGTAARLGMPLITKDTQISESGIIETVW